MVWQAAAIAGGSKIIDRHFARQDVRRGFRLENHYGFKREAEMWRRAQERGLTPQEYYGSPAAGGSYPTGGAQTLGNASLQSTQMLGDLFNAEQDREVERRGQDIDLKKAKLGYEASIYGSDQSYKGTMGAATKSSNAVRYSAWIQKEIAANRLRLDEKAYRNIHLPAAQAELKLTKAQTEKVLNEVVTSHPKYVATLKMMQMSSENMIATMLAKEAGIDLADEETYNRVPPEKRKALISAMIGAGSFSRKEIEGIFALLSDHLSIPEYDGPPSLGAGNKSKSDSSRWNVFDQPWLRIGHDSEWREKRQ